MRAQAVVQTSGSPPAFLPTIADEDLPVHFRFEDRGIDYNESRNQNFISAPVFSSAELQYPTLSIVILPEGVSAKISRAKALVRFSRYRAAQEAAQYEKDLN